MMAFDAQVTEWISLTAPPVDVEFSNYDSFGPSAFAPAGQFYSVDFSGLDFPRADVTIAWRPLGPIGGASVSYRITFEFLGVIGDAAPPGFSEAFIRNDGTQTRATTVLGVLSTPFTFTGIGVTSGGGDVFPAGMLDRGFTGGLSFRAPAGQAAIDPGQSIYLVPEPGAGAFLATGMMLLVYRRRRLR